MADTNMLLRSHIGKLEGRIAELEAQALSEEDEALLTHSISTAQASVAQLCQQDDSINALLTASLLKYPELLEVASKQQAGLDTEETAETKLNVVTAQRPAIYSLQDNLSQVIKLTSLMPTLQQSQALVSQGPKLEALQKQAAAQQAQVEELAAQTEELLMSWYAEDLRAANQMLSHLGLERLAAEIAGLRERPKLSY
ncbi:hypothetical protein BCR37DRAFT_379304 [Protomyces lactucae-debilis]|uniref:Uncharacterized protein n=1 Tax=Protomyces lactucae-debilis TaxID=2754530 RepID=A0A1Y2FIR3_PROLT|nr:uncharacterized protein BCR37DRAFT_379304 [Protomyces lactucae-debilis]ORY83274.1 hypothetical protein BCR37DRAFT_379304 [Protomyces lactucae-debilis]